MPAIVRTVLILIITLPLAATPALAQNVGPQRADVEFAGGNVALYLGLLRSTYDRANIVATAGAEDVELKPITLMQSTLSDAVAALQWATADADTRLLIGRHGDLHSVHLPGEESRRARKQTHVWTVASILESGYEADDLLSAIETALSLATDDATVRFHEGADLLIVNATEEQFRTVEITIDRLNEAATFRLERQSDADIVFKYNAARQEIAELRDDRAQLLSQIQALEITIAKLRAASSN